MRAAPLPLKHSALACDNSHLASQIHHWRCIFDPELPHALHTAHQANEALCHAGNALGCCRSQHSKLQSCC